jgi:hypothetical protein
MSTLTPAEAGALIRNREFLITLQRRCNSEGQMPAIQVALAREAKAAVAERAQAGDSGRRYRKAQMRLSSSFQLYLEAMGETVVTYFPEGLPESGAS